MTFPFHEDGRLLLQLPTSAEAERARIRRPDRTKIHARSTGRHRTETHTNTHTHTYLHKHTHILINLPDEKETAVFRARHGLERRDISPDTADTAADRPERVGEVAKGPGDPTWFPIREGPEAAVAGAAAADRDKNQDQEVPNCYRRLHNMVAAADHPAWVQLRPGKKRVKETISQSHGNSRCCQSCS